MRFRIPTAPRPAAYRERGAAAVEAGLVVSVLLVPLVVGVLQWGDYFWRAQRVNSLSPPIAAGAVAGTFTCAGLKTVVAGEVASTVAALNPDLGTISASDVTVTVLEMLPSVGVIVQISIRSDAPSGLSSLVPLPNDGAMVVEFVQRLSDVKVSDTVCR